MPSEKSCSISHPTIGAVIATTERSAHRILSWWSANRAALSRFDEIVITGQCWTNEGKRSLQHLFQDPSFEGVVRGMQLGRGLSRNRNFGLSLARADTIWFLDDDVIVEPQAAEHLRSALAAANAQALCCRMRLTESGKLAKRYGPARIIGRLGVLKVSSVEILVDRRFLSEHGIRFNESLGIGTRLCSGEENMLLLDILRANGRIVHFPEALVSHSEAGRCEQTALARPGQMEAMGVIARACGIWGPALIAYWSLRAIQRGVSPGRPLAMFVAYFKERVLQQI